ncbi:MAG: cytochrome c oxidase subunit 3 [Planctomycetota bacterium]|jgi:heme/copper-type cytochrome/quinol oxidase subunit 3
MSDGHVVVKYETVGVPTPRLGMWLFLASEIMFFASFVGSYIVLRMGASTWPDPNEILWVPLLAFNTFVLITSSATMVMAHQAREAGDTRKLKKMLLATAGLGLLFLAIKVGDYIHLVNDKDFVIGESLFASCYYTLTGFHGLHVLAGVVALLVGAKWAGSGRMTREGDGYVEGVGLYWHFVDLVWIVLFAILCLV